MNREIKALLREPKTVTRVADALYCTWMDCDRYTKNNIARTALSELEKIIDERGL